MINFMRSQLLARMPKDAPERCLYEGHRFSEWGRYVPEMPTPNYSFGDFKDFVHIDAWRCRQCTQCGCVETQNYDRSVQKIAKDPTGIAKRLGQMDCDIDVHQKVLEDTE